MIVDKGPWNITTNMELQSDDFMHDVRIKINGDFEGLADRLRYEEKFPILLMVAGVPYCALCPTCHKSVGNS